MTLKKGVQGVLFFFRCSRARCPGMTYVVGSASDEQPRRRTKLDPLKVKFWWPAASATRRQPVATLEALEAHMFLRMDGNTYLHGTGPDAHWAEIMPSATGKVKCPVCKVEGGLSHLSRQDEDG